MKFPLRVPIEFFSLALPMERAWIVAVGAWTVSRYSNHPLYWLAAFCLALFFVPRLGRLLVIWGILVPVELAPDGSLPRPPLLELDGKPVLASRERDSRRDLNLFKAGAGLVPVFVAAHVVGLMEVEGFWHWPMPSLPLGDFSVPAWAVLEALSALGGLLLLIWGCLRYLIVLNWD